MSIIETFESFLQDPNIEVQELASRAQEIKMYREHGQITEEEYNELVEDLLELRSVNREMMSLDVQLKLNKLTNFLKNVKFFASII
jgi:argininosuccinate lyase